MGSTATTSIAASLAAAGLVGLLTVTGRSASCLCESAYLRMEDIAHKDGRKDQAGSALERR